MRCNDADPVAELQPRIGRGDKIHVAAADSCDGSAELFFQVKLVNLLADHGVV